MMAFEFLWDVSRGEGLQIARFAWDDNDIANFSQAD
jgi:hypothetical protein